MNATADEEEVVILVEAIGETAAFRIARQHSFDLVGYSEKLRNPIARLIGGQCPSDFAEINGQQK